jgi:hypothetical protein
MLYLKLLYISVYHFPLCYLIICYSAGIIRQTQLLQFTGVFICISSYMFRPLIWPSSGYLKGVYFLFTLLYLQYTYIYTTN